LFITIDELVAGVEIKPPLLFPKLTGPPSN